MSVETTAPMRILHVTPYWADAWGYGGIPRVVGALVRHLAASGHDVTVCATDVHSAHRRLTPPESTGARRGDAWRPIRMHERIELRVFPNLSNRAAYAWQFYTPAGLHRYLRDHAHEFDVAHLHACRNFPGALAAHYLDRYGVPYVLAPNGTAPIIERRQLAKRLVDIVAGRRILTSAAAVIAVSEAERRQLLALGVADERIRSLPNPLELDEFRAPIERGVFRQRLGWSNAPLVAFLGKITPRKRLDVVVRAFARLNRDARLVVAGNDMGGLAAARRLAQVCGVADSVHFTGLLEGRERLQLMADADVVVYPGEHEVFGLVPLEAILAGTPVVVAGDSGCGEVIGRTGGGLIVAAGDTPALASAIAQVLNAKPQWGTAVRTSAARIRREYGAGEVTDRLAALYASLAQSAATRATAVNRMGVSFVVPVRNGMPFLPRAIESIEAQADGRPMEIIAVDDRSEDESPAWLAERASEGRLRLLAGAGRGVSAALNLGVSAARYPIVCQVDQDVELLPGWMTRLSAAVEGDPRLGAVQGHYTVNPAASPIARAMALDVEQRYLRLSGGTTDHVCTGNTVYRASAIREAGFDESLGYGNDSDMSRRLRAAGWRLGHCRQARSFHNWRDTFAGYCRQQYGFGYGRLDVVFRTRGSVTGDAVSPWPMMAHALLMCAALAAAAGGFWIIGLTVAAMLFVERVVAGVLAFWRFGDPAALLFPPLHLARDVAWVAAIVTWTLRRALGRTPRVSDSMKPRATPARRNEDPRPTGFIPRPTRTIGIIPAHNEAATIGAVLADVRECHPELSLLVVDDGSEDDTAGVVARSGVRWLRLPERMGIGTAMRAGLRYARRLGYDTAVRLDADGQHQAADINRLLAPIIDARADAVLGSRFLASPADGPALVRAARRTLAACLSLLTGRAVTDPTSGFCAFGPRAMRLLAEDHPTGYPEPEMFLLFSRHALTVIEVPIAARPRLGGRTSLTVARLAAAAARVLLALLIVPLRRGARRGDSA